MSYFILFVSAVTSATILPFSSEAILLGLMTQPLNVLLLWLAASAGNVTGACINWFLGKYLLHYQKKSWFPFSQKSLLNSQIWFQRYGVWSLLFSWLPIIGDALTFFAGVMNVKLPLFLILTAIGKAGRYALIIYLFLQLQS